MGLEAYPAGIIGPIGATGATGATGPTGGTGATGATAVPSAMLSAKLVSGSVQPGAAPSGNTRLTFDTVASGRTSTGFTFPITSGRQTGIVVPKTGVYDIVAEIGLAANSQTIRTMIAINGSGTLPDGTDATDFIGNVAGNGAFETTRQVKTRVSLTAGDLVELYYQQATAASQIAQATYVWLDVMLCEGQTGATGGTGATGATGPSLQPLTMTAKSANYAAVSGDYVVCTGSFSVTLPVPTAGRVVGVKAQSGQTGAAPVTVATLLGAATIYGPGIGVASAGATSLSLGNVGAFVTLQADGTNWHVIDGGQDTGWIAYAYAAGWADYGAGYSQTGSYRKDAEGIVHLRNLITKSSAMVAGETMFTLPAGFRPGCIEIFNIHGSATSSGAKRFDLTSAGLATCPEASPGAGAYMSMASIQFQAVN